MSQNDTLTMNYKLERCLKAQNPTVFYNYLINNKFSSKEILNITSYTLYHGNETFGNALQNLCISKMDSISSDDYQSVSVQQTKNGNYHKAIEYLKKSISLDVKSNESYFGWLLLYYYRDYKNSLKHLNHFDSLTPNFIDAPVGENIHFLKGLCYYQLNQYNEALQEFSKNERFEIDRFGKRHCNSYIYFYKARCYDKMNDFVSAEQQYNNAIKQSHFATEANYYLGLSLMSQNKNRVAKKHLSLALELINKGYKQQDIYVELFDEVYQSQIEGAIKTLKNRL